VLHSSSDRFNGAVLSYELVDDNEDGVFEPGSTYLIRNVCIVNNGGLPLPKGCTLSFPSTPTARWLDADRPHLLPQIDVGSSWTVLGAERVFRFQIPSMAAAEANRPFRASTCVTSSVRCLDRPFLESEICTGHVAVQWPIQVAAVQATTYLAPGESTSIIVRLNNISSRGYGTERMGRVEVRLRLHPLMMVCPSPDGSYAVTAEGGVAIREFHAIPPFSEVNVSVLVMMRPDAATELFESFQWSADLYLRNKCIQYHTGSVRVTPLFQPAVFSDVVLVTCPAIDRKEFLAWR
jgi:hypothetical protein